MIDFARRFAWSLFCAVFTAGRGCLDSLRGERIKAAERRLDEAERRVLAALAKGG